MSKPFILANSDTDRVETHFRRYLKSSDEIWIASPFFSEAELLTEILKKPVTLKVLVGLQYPTHPDMLRSLLKNRIRRVDTKFYNSRFHSKVYMFFKAEEPVAAIIGSSNFTDGGMSTNIETNVVFKDIKFISLLREHFQSIWDDAGLLSPPVIDAYEKRYKRLKTLSNKMKAESNKYEKKFVKPRLKRSKVRIIKEARDYFGFWKAVDQIERIIRPVSRKEWPKVRTYLTLNHFWHWVKAIDEGKSIRKYKLNQENRSAILPKLFKLYIDWTKESEDDSYYASTGALINERKLKSLLNRKHILKLSRREARIIYWHLHSGWMRMQRFGGDELFAAENSLERIRKSLNYLLWSDDDIDKRISALIRHPDYKLKHFGPSNVQELLGWVHKEYPIRNDKADDAVEMLGFKFR